ncbi:MAG TPA: aryl-sulfate sulfotransferase, partial [Steroidobacteraceae bacterium]|nr:aryl-sulfate sulfotransferase [Steroidobacteraceae bacterium]
SESSIPSVFTDNGFVIGDKFSTKVRRLELDGTDTVVPVAFPGYRKFHHNIDPGKVGLLGEFSTPTDQQSTIAEFTLSGGVLKEWDFATIVRDHMMTGGDDSTLFVRPPNDWFHTNAAAYDPRDDSLIVSSRENFVMNVDYETGAIRWLLGDPTKYWWTFPSLRAKALTLTGGGLYPIGQHAVSLTSDGLLLLFNAGTASDWQPEGAPIGESREYSAVSAYRIDAATMTATNVWNFDYGRSIYSGHCSSAYEAGGHSLLITYARADNVTHARLVGLNSQHEVVFDFQYDTSRCDTAWNGVPIPLENMSFP